MKIKFNTKKYRRFLEKLPEFLAANAFVFFLCLLFLDLVIGALIFHQYSFLAINKEIAGLIEPLGFKREILQSAIEHLDVNKKRFDETETKTYPDFFRDRESVNPEELTE